MASSYTARPVLSDIKLSALTTGSQITRRHCALVLHNSCLLDSQNHQCLSKHLATRSTLDRHPLIVEESRRMKHGEQRTRSTKCSALDQRQAETSLRITVSASARLKQLIFVFMFRFASFRLKRKGHLNNS